MSHRVEEDAVISDPELVIRLQRIATRKVPQYRVVVAEAGSRVDGRFLEQVGIYDPMQDANSARFTVDRLRFWVDAGARPMGEAQALVRNALSVPAA
jgi:small subunit ribosomal protein S16